MPGRGAAQRHRALTEAPARGMIDEHLMETLGPPYLLIATPTLLDPNFVQTVVLIGHHDAEGAMGWIINRLHERPVRELLAPSHQPAVHAETPLHLGGPVPSDALLASLPRGD